MGVTARINPREGRKDRWCIDYRKLNSVTKKDINPLPFIEECIATLSANEGFSKLDSTLLLHLSINIICSAQEVLIEVETDDSRKVYAASRSDWFAGVYYSVDEILKFQEEDPDL